MKLEEVTKANVKFFDEMADNYEEVAKEQQYYPGEVAYIDRLIKETFSAKRDGLVLDIGTGTGYTIDFLTKYSERIVGLDIAHKMLKKAKARHPRIRFIKADAYKLPFKNKSFDFIICNAFLHHLYDYKLFLNTTLSLLKDEGTIFIGHEPNHYFWRLFFWFGRHIFRYLEHDLTKKYDIKSVEYHQYCSLGIDPGYIKKMLKERGFREIKIFYSNISLGRQIYKILKLNINLPMTCFGPNLSANFNIIARL